MLRCSLNLNPQSVIRYQQFALWVKMSNIYQGKRIAVLKYIDSVRKHQGEFTTTSFGSDVGALRPPPLTYRVCTKRPVLCTHVGFEKLRFQPALKIIYRLITKGDQKVRGKVLLNRIAYIDFYENS